jgi:1-acyl-sn-glycerol-3-phosphate acyltransferase
MKPFRRLYFAAMYYGSWFWFGLVGLLLNLFCALLLPLPRTQALQRRTRAAISRLFDLWTRWLHACGVVKVRWIGCPARLPGGTIYVANHPSLIDATLLLARMSDAFCIFKPALMQNPCIAPAAILGGYVAGGRHADTLREAADKVSAGQSLLVFPEGTRTSPGHRLEPFKAGFVVIAQRARAPIQLIVIRAMPALVTRGRRWWAVPPVLPATVEITLDRRWEANPETGPHELCEEIHRHLLAQLPDPVA